MADFPTVIQNLRQNNQFNRAANLPQIQFFGPGQRRYRLAELLPEVTRENNQYDEEDYHVIDVIASDIDAYSPPPFKGSFVEAAAFNVRFGDSGLALQMGTALYSKIVGMLARTASMERVAREILNFNGSIISGMLTHNELQRAKAIVKGLVIRKVNQTNEPIQYPNNPGQRVAIVDAWSDPNYDPVPDLFAQNTRARELGYAGVARILATGEIPDMLLSNPHVQRRIGNIVVVGAPATEYAEYADIGALDAYLRRNQLPPIETFDETYRDQDGSHRYVEPGTMIFVYRTDRRVQDILEQDLDQAFIPDNRGGGIGYTGIGTTAGHEDLGPGRWSNLTYHDGARPHVKGEGVQKGLPVFNEPNGFGVYENIH